MKIKVTKTVHTRSQQEVEVNLLITPVFVHLWDSREVLAIIPVKSESDTTGNEVSEYHIYYASKNGVIFYELPLRKVKYLMTEPESLSCPKKTEVKDLIFGEPVCYDLMPLESFIKRYNDFREATSFDVSGKNINGNQAIYKL